MVPIVEPAIDVTTAGGVTLVTMRSGENTFGLPFVTVLERTLRTAADEGRPLVLTGSGKFFSNGLDLEWLAGAGPDGGRDTMAALHRVLALLLAFPGATVAAVNGHAFGAGAILAAAADMRIMRRDRGYFCFPEVDLGLAMSEQFDAVLQAKYSRPALLTGLLTGERYGGEAAMALGFVDDVAADEELVPAALARAGALAGKDGATVGAIKRSLYREPLATLGKD
jgi:enoyl-CoA hydratase/carnithine racemase